LDKIGSLASNGNSDIALNYEFSLSAANAAIAGTMATGLLVLLPFSSKRHKLFVFIIGITLATISCTKVKDLST